MTDFQQTETNIMKRLSAIALIFVLSLATSDLFAQKNAKPNFETIYRPVYGYIVDSLTNTPYKGISVYAFDSIDDARIGEGALQKGRSPMGMKLKGDVVETKTDDTGRYMVPARSTGALVIYIKEKKEIIVEEIAGRSEISRGRQRTEKEWFDISKYLADNPHTPRKPRHKGPEGIVVDMNFKAYIPQPGDKGKEARVVVERRIVDLETGELLSSEIPVVRDGKKFHKQRRKMIAKGLMTDSLYVIADAHPVLTDSTSSIRVIDHMETEPWKERCFGLSYYVTMEHAGEVKQLDTMYMMTNRINKPLKHLQYDFEPYHWEEQETTEKRRAVTRRLVLEGVYDGQVPQVLKDSSYVLRELHIKATVAQKRAYEECIAQADSMVSSVMDGLRIAFEGKINENVRITKTSQVSPDSTYADNVSYRYIFTTGRQFSRNEYLLQIRRAKDDARLERLCRQAMEERQILDGTSWDYAANVLARLHMDQGRVDTEILAPFVDRSLDGCDIAIEDPVTFEPSVMNRSEIVANQVIMLMRNGEFGRAADLAQMLPDGYATLREVALCKDGKKPEDEGSKELLRQSSLRNRVLVDMVSDKVDGATLEALDSMPQDEAMTWYLRARAHCIMHENKSWDMQAATLEGTGQNVYEHVLECLRKCFAIDPSMVQPAKYDSEINEYALKEVLGVYVL